MSFIERYIKATPGMSHEEQTMTPGQIAFESYATHLLGLNPTGAWELLLPEVQNRWEAMAHTVLNYNPNHPQVRTNPDGSQEYGPYYSTNDARYV